MQELTLEDRTTLGKIIVSILDDWGLQAPDQISILDLPKNTPTRTIRKYREQVSAIPADTNVMERIRHIVGIADALRTTFPRNAQMGSQWMNKPSRRFNDQTPLSVMLQGGLSGVKAVRAHLDCTYAWSQTD